MRKLCSCLLLMLVLCGLPGVSLGGQVLVSAAASLTDALKELAAEFRKQQPQVRVHGNFGGSGSLARQIEQGAPVDLFISANPVWVEYLAARQLLDQKSMTTFARNSLVLFTLNRRPPADLRGATTLKRIALGNPESVPAGDYARQALQAVGIYTMLEDEHRLLFTKDVRQALLYAMRGEVEGAFVYLSDLRERGGGDSYLLVPADLHQPIVYLLAITAKGRQNPEVTTFASYLVSSEAAEVLEKYGFIAGP